jgi:hypothetical protein
MAGISLIARALPNGHVRMKPLVVQLLQVPSA